MRRSSKAEFSIAHISAVCIAFSGLLGAQSGVTNQAQGSALRGQSIPSQQRISPTLENVSGIPVLETLYVPPAAGLKGRVTSVSYSGSIQIQPADSIVLRLRAPYPSTLQILINGQPLALVTNNAPAPQPDTAGYFTVAATPMPGWPDKIPPTTPGYNWFFWSVAVKLPQQFRFSPGRDIPGFTLTVRDVIQGTRLGVAAAGALSLQDLNLQMTGYSSASCRPLASGIGPLVPSLCPPDASAPSVVFQSGDNSKDTPEWFNVAGLKGPHMPRATLGVVARDVTLAGWLVATPGRNDPLGGQCASGKSEDWHFDIHLDPDFIQRNYPSGDLLPFFGAIMPGQPEDEACWAINPSYGCPCLAPGCAAKISLTGGRPPDVSTFSLPGSDLDIELNAWHTDARGPKPARYVADNDPTADADPNADHGCGAGWSHALNAWAFKPRARTILPGVEAPGRLQAGDYVIVTGTLWQDIPHLKSVPGPEDLPIWHLRKCVNDVFAGQGGWLEIHPVDVVRYVAPAPPLRKHVSRLTTCVSQSADTFQTTPNKPNFWNWNWITIPDPPPPGPNYILHHEEISDPRFRAPGTQVNLQVPYDPCRTSLAVSDGLMSPSGSTVSDSVTVLTWWEMSNAPRPPCPIQANIATAVVQQSPLTLHVAITDSQTKQPISQATVTVFDMYGRPQSSAVTGADGTVMLNYKSCARKTSCQGLATKSGVLHSSFLTPLLSAVATNWSSLDITVRDEAANTMLQGAMVNCLDPSGKQLATGTTDRNGKVRLSGCRSGGKVTVSKPGYPGCSFDAPYLGGTAQCP